MTGRAGSGYALPIGPFQRRGVAGAARCHTGLKYRAALSVADGAAGLRAAAADFPRRAEEAYPIRGRGCARVPATRGQGTTSRIDRSRSSRLRLSARPPLPRPGNRTQSHSLHCPLLKRRSAGPARERAEGRARARCGEPGQSVARGRRQTTVRKDVLITPDGGG